MLKIALKFVLQMLFKFFKNFVNFNNLISTFLIFKIDYKIIKLKVLLLIISQKLITLNKAINKIKRIMRRNRLKTHETRKIIYLPH